MAAKMADKISLVVALPPFGVASALFVLFESWGIATLHSQQKTKPAAYSKFKKDKKDTDDKPKEESGFKMPPRAGAALVYSLPAIAGGAFLCYQFYTRYFDKSQAITIKNVVETVKNLSMEQIAVLLPAAMITAHFKKRIFECLFVHKYSAKSHAMTMKGLRLVMGISGGYASACLGCMYFQNKAPRAFNQTRINVGVSTFALGLLGNGYHHYILASLRKDAKSAKEETDKTKKYTIPEGGLFGLVWCPHYLFELMGWYGIAITANTLNFWLMAGVYTSYLTGRAKSTEEWYLKVFRNDSRLNIRTLGRKAIIPFLY